MILKISLKILKISLKILKISLKILKIFLKILKILCIQFEFYRQKSVQLANVPGYEESGSILDPSLASPAPQSPRDPSGRAEFRDISGRTAEKAARNDP